MIRSLFRYFSSLTRRSPKGANSTLRGKPSVRRLKMYQAETGLSWSYYYEGYRPEAEPMAARCFEFTLFSGGRVAQSLSVAIPDSVLIALSGEAGRDISSREVYALAKMHLFSVLDAEAHPAAGARYELSEGAAREIWAGLDL